MDSVSIVLKVLHAMIMDIDSSLGLLMEPFIILSAKILSHVRYLLIMISVVIFKKYWQFCTANTKFVCKQSAIVRSPPKERKPVLSLIAVEVRFSPHFCRLALMFLYIYV